MKTISEKTVPPIDKNDLKKAADIAYEFYIQVNDKIPEMKKEINIDIEDHLGEKKTVKTTIYCYMAYPDNYEEIDPEERKDGYLINGMANVKTLQIWFPIIKFNPFPRYPKENFKNKIMFTLAHELAHIQNWRPKYGRIGHKARKPLTNNDYHYLAPEEMDANVNAIIRLYHIAERPETYTLETFLNEYKPEMVAKFKTSRKWRQKLITRLAREGIAFKNVRDGERI